MMPKDERGQEIAPEIRGEQGRTPQETRDRGADPGEGRRGPGRPPSPGGIVTREKAREQERELLEFRQATQLPAPAPEAPKGAEPGSTPWKPISADSEAAAELFFAEPEDVASTRVVWDETAYGAPVRHYY